VNFKIKIKKWDKLLIVLIATVTSGLAQTIDPVELVLEVNREVLAAEKAYQAAKEKIEVSGVLPDPMLESSFSINAIETRNGPIENQIMLGQRFPLWGELRRERNIEKIRASISELNLDKTKVKISFLLRKGVADYLKLSESLEILEQYKIELESFENIAQSQYANGLGLTLHPIIKLQIETALIESKINDIESNLEKSINDLQILFDGQFSTSLIGDTFQLKYTYKPAQYWLNLANKYNPSFAISQANIAIAADQQKLAKLKNYPDLTAGLTYSFVGPTDLGGAPSSGADALGIKVGINLPLWFKKNKARVKSASFNLQQQEILLSNIWNNVEYDILSILKELDEIKDTYTIYDERLIRETEQMLSSSYSAYETGKISFLDLLDSVRMGVKIKLEFAAVKSKQNILIAKLHQNVGIIRLNQENYDEN
jgi:outer membrane protein TolC